MVQENCAAACPALPNLSTAASCTGSGTVAAKNCKRTEYIDNLTYILSGTVFLRGGSKDQQLCVATGPNGENWCGAPPGPWPFALTDCTRTGLTPDALTAGVPNPAWWPGENRRIVPRFFNRCSVTATAAPSEDFPQVAACGAVSVVNRCTTATTTTDQEACIDLPITVVPGHQTVVTSADETRCGTSGIPCECGQPGNPYTCAVNNNENGGQQAAWGLDIREPILDQRLTALGLNGTFAVGTLATVWITRTTAGRIRFLFGALNRVAAGQTYRFTENVTIAETQTGGYASPGYSLTISIEFSITPKGWCKWRQECGCVHSYCENGPATLNVAMYAKAIGCGNCGATNFAASFIMGLEEYSIPICAFPAVCAGATPNCMQYPVTNACAQYHPPNGPLFIDYVGAVPLERAHAGWRMYRNRYNHYYCLNTITGGIGCCAGAKNVASGGISHLCLPECTRLDPAWVATHGPCAGADPDCANHLQPPAQTAGGCHPVQYISGQQKVAPWPDGPACNTCNQNWFQCGPMYFVGNCGTANYADCSCCNTQATVSLPEILIVDFDPRNACTPVGTWTLFSATASTACDRSAWLEIGYAVVQ